jgi:hypothetical protein
MLALNPNPDGYIKKCVAMWLGVIYDSQANSRKKGGLLVRAPLTRTPIGCLGVIYYSQPVRIHKNITTNRWKLLLLD